MSNKENKLLDSVEKNLNDALSIIKEIEKKCEPENTDEEMKKDFRKLIIYTLLLTGVFIIMYSALKTL